jgi:hypothetical protein
LRDPGLLIFRDPNHDCAAAAPPPDYSCDFSAPLTLFEGRNGSGKTSLANAILWGLTGEILRPQREPEKADEEFECSVAGADPGQEPICPYCDVARRSS